MKDKTVVLPEWFFEELMESMKSLAEQINRLTLPQEPISGYAAEEDMAKRLKEAELKIEDLIDNKVEPGLWESPDARIAAIEQQYKGLTHSLKHELDGLLQRIKTLEESKLREEIISKQYDFILTELKINNDIRNIDFSEPNTTLMFKNVAMPAKEYNELDRRLSEISKLLYNTIDESSFVRQRLNGIDERIAALKEEQKSIIGALMDLQDEVYNHKDKETGSETEEVYDPNAEVEGFLDLFQEMLFGEGGRR